MVRTQVRTTYEVCTGVITRWSQRRVDFDVERERSKSVVARYNAPR